MRDPVPAYPPPLAGLATRERAARVGPGVDETVRRLLRLQWFEQRLAWIATAHLPGTPEWEVKCALALHQWLDTEHADALRTRIAEMRHPVPRLDQAPDAALDAFLAELLRAEDSIELVVGLYGVARPALLEACRAHYAEANPLVDQPTRRILRTLIAEEEEACAWGERACAAVCEPAGAEARADAWRTHLRAYLAAAGGVLGPSPAGTTPLPAPRAAAPFSPRTEPRRDARFRGQHNFEFPPQVLYPLEHIPAEERNLALLCKRLLEMDVPEMMASFMVERDAQPWGFRRDYARQLWDEARHAMMGEVALSARGLDWRAIPLNVGFSLRLNLHAEPLERQILLFGIEQTLMPGDTGKRYEYRTACDAGDPLSAHFHDFDWADEVLHAQIGRRWLKEEGISVQDAMDRAARIHERTWRELDRYRHLEPQDGGWWDALVRRALGRPSAARPEDYDDPRVVGE